MARDVQGNFRIKAAFAEPIFRWMGGSGKDPAAIEFIVAGYRTEKGEIAIMPLKLALRPSEKIVINQAVIVNGGQKTEFVLENKASVLCLSPLKLSHYVAS